MRALIQDSHDLNQLKQLVRIEYQGNQLTWNDFYYDRSRYYILTNRLERKFLGYPIALSVTIKSDPEYYEKAKYPWTIKCYGNAYEAGDARLIPIPAIKTKSEELARLFEVKRNYIVLGNVWLSRIKDDNPFRNFYVNVFHQSQFKVDIEN